MDTEKVLKCPACGSKMHKIYIPDLEINLDMCLNGCGGILFDNTELTKILSSDNIAENIIKYLNNTSFKMPDKSDLRVCPVCNNPMDKIGDEIELDICSSCGAKFLDCDELEKIREKKKG